MLYNDGWKFLKQPLDTDYGTVKKRLEKFEPVDIPHDWLISQVNDLYEDSTGWYRKIIYVEKLPENYVFLRFDGVYMDCRIYLNGQEIYQWKYGYSTFDVELTGHLMEGENELMVSVRNQCPNSRWYAGAGIYRNVWYDTKEDWDIAKDGIYVHTEPLENGSYQANVQVEIKHFAGIDAEKNAEEQPASVLITLIDKETGEIVGRSTEQVRLGSDEVLKVQKEYQVKEPKLWNLSEPSLYQVEVCLRRGEKETKEVTEFGFRQIHMEPDRGFFLNGQHVKLNGICEHHDLGALGSAFHRVAMKRKLEILKEMGANALRTSHNMPDPAVMELCDEMGILVVSESFDCWESGKNPWDYGRFFKEWYQKDVASWVRRDRNHPSLILWSIGNEIYDTHSSPHGQEITRELVTAVREHDPLENAGITIGSNYMPWENAQNCADIVKIAGYNYSEKYYEEHHRKHPDWIIYGSETSSLVQSRGIYHFPLKAGILAEDDEQCSALGNSATSWGTKSMETCITEERDHTFSMGQFLWTGFDYIGEPTPYHTKNSYFGQVDTAGFPKDSYYVYQAEWTSCKENPMIHIFPYWDHNIGQLIDVRVCSNASEVELFLNGSSQGRKKLEHQTGCHILADYQLRYEPGELKAVGYDEEGNIVAEEWKHSFREAAELRVMADKKELCADGRDLIFLTITAVDGDGYPVENAGNYVEVSVEGAGRLAGLDNGDSTDQEEYKGTVRRMFSGKLLAIVEAVLEPGPIYVRVTSKGLKDSHVELSAYQGGLVEGVTAQERIAPSPEPKVIPVRKIELTALDGQKMTAEVPEVRVRTKVCPANATDQEIFYRLTDDNGVDTNLAELRQEEGLICIRAKGDGRFRLRAMSKSSTERIRLISSLEFEAEGLGRAYLDPYGFVSASLYSGVSGTVTNGNERGVATARDGQTCVCFRDLDFGRTGADRITLPLFCLDSDPLRVRIYDELPEAGGELLADMVYQKPSIWNVYQSETYQLERCLKGIQSLCFCVERKVHIKGFQFERRQRAYIRHAATEADHIYGDHFVKKEDCVEQIGNNVAFEYLDMDLGEKGVSAIAITGRTKLKKNTIHVRFTDEEGRENKQILEFEEAEKYETRTFPLLPVMGKQKLTLFFMPGSSFDLREIQLIEA